MDLSPQVTLAVLGAALLHAGWNALFKSSPDKALENVALAVSRGALALACVPWLPLPAPASWPWLAASVVVHVAYFWALAGAYRWGDLSFAYPVMRGGAPVLVALASIAVFGEALSWAQGAAVAFICGGILAFASGPRGDVRAGRRALLFAVGNAAVIATYTLIDARGVRVSGAAVSYALWFFIANSVVQIALGAARRGAEIPAYLRRHWLRAAVGGALTLGSYGIALWAMTRAPVALVAAVRETSVIFAAALGALFLGERITLRRAGATTAVLAGLLALRL
ncbi:MAG TPA: EamA family transporter [Burkholderiales bacterium]|nr:EamA family transporter [Burkholderiales bacterium]